VVLSATVAVLELLPGRLWALWKVIDRTELNVFWNEE
jgi:hypothetical protein